MNNRRAVSLVELLVVMTACSVVLTMSASLLHRAMHWQSRSRAFYDAERSALRLASEFRNDVHRATSVSISNGAEADQSQLRLQFADQTTASYAHAGRSITRTVSRPDSAGSLEEFEFPSLFTLEFRQQASPARVTLTLTAKRGAANAGRSMPVDMQIEASLGTAATQGELP